MSDVKRKLAIAKLRGKVLMSFDMWFENLEQEHAENGLTERFERMLEHDTVREWFVSFISETHTAIQVGTA